MPTSLANGVSYPLWVQGISEFQQLGLVNKAVMATVGIDIPYIALAKNKKEREERAMRQLLIFLFLFTAAPLHSFLLAKHFAKQIQPLPKAPLRKALLRFKFTELHSLDAFEKAVHERLPQAKKYVNEALRKSVLTAKTQHLSYDLAAEGGLVASIGLFKVLFSEWQTGNKQFTGEAGLASASDLKALYEKEKQPDPFGIPHGRELLAILGATLVPFAFGKALQHNALHPTVKPHAWQRFLNGCERHFDYNFSEVAGKLYPKLKEIPMLPLSGIALVALCLNGGDIASSRSPRDFKENTVRSLAFFASVFIVGPLMNKCLNKGVVTIRERLALEAKAGSSPDAMRRIAKASALKYVGVFLTNLAMMVGVVIGVNEMTKRGLKKDLAQLHTPKTPRVIQA
ncbi:MAG: hypothetical protein HEQ32_07350 [Vampirovibrio sp.]